jgi:hypothetical protein
MVFWTITKHDLDSDWRFFGTLTVTAFTLFNWTSFIIETVCLEVITFVLATSRNWSAEDGWASTLIFILDWEFTALTHLKFWALLLNWDVIAWAAVLTTFFHDSEFGVLNGLAHWVIIGYDIWALMIFGWWHTWRAFMAVIIATFHAW